MAIRIPSQRSSASASHHSQLDWMREHDHIDFADLVRTCSRYRGYQCGAAYAEGFRMCKAYLKGTTRRLLP